MPLASAGPMAGALFPIILAIVIGVLAGLAGWMPFSPFVGVVVLTLLIGPVLGLIEMIKSMERGTHTPGESH